MIDVILLRIMRHRSDYYKLIGVIPRTTLDPRTILLIDNFGRYFEKYPTHTEVDLVTFLPRFRAWYPCKEDVFNTLLATLRNSMPEADDDQKRNIVQELGELQLATRLSNLVSQHTEGELDTDLTTEIGAALDSHRSLLGLRHQTWIDTPIGELLAEEFQESGVRWRLQCLNRSTRPLRPGDFGIVAGRPDKGKTSFIASEITHFAPQLPADKNVLWLNNEGPGKRIIPRLYQAALDLSMTQMKELQTEGKLVDMYREAMGRLDRVRVVDIHSMTNGQVETIIEDHNPGVIIYDMIDNIKGFGDAARTDLALEAMYQWGRERSVKYDCIGIATSQISNDGDGLQFPTLGMLKDSKTGKQGACDFQLMIGASNDPGLTGSRFLSLPKNKLRRPDGPADPRAEVIFDGLRSRYRDPPQIGVE
jgi:replicative DNA helicase